MRFATALVTLFLLFPCRTVAQASVNVSTLDPVYRTIDKLVGHGLVDDIIMGQRPFSRIEIARIIVAAETNLPRLSSRLADSTLSLAKRRAAQVRLLERPLSTITR